MERRVLVINTVNMGFTGITSIIMNYVRKTYKTIKYDFVLCGKVEKSFADELESFGSKIFIPPCSRVKKTLAYYAWLKRVIKENGYDIIHVHGNSGTMYFEVHAAKTVGVPIRIAHSHSTSCRFKLAHRLLKPLLNCEMTHGIACSDQAGKWLFTRDFIVLPNGIDVEKFAFSQVVRDEYRKKLELEDKFVIGHVGYMDVEKNHMFLLRILEIIIKKRTDFKLLLIGDGRLRPEIESFIEAHNLKEYVQLLGKRADVAQLYQCMDVLVLPSLFEGLPVTLVESQAAGLRCVVSNAVTKQVNITGNIEYVGIEDADIPNWIDIIFMTTKPIRRENMTKVVENTIYNIDNCIKELYSIYK